MAALAAIITPAVVISRRRAQASACLSNMRQWQNALQSYTQDYDGSYPPALTSTFVDGDAKRGGEGWYSFLTPYTGRNAFICPSVWVSGAFSDRIYSCGYALNVLLNNLESDGHKSKYQGAHESVVHIPASTITVFDVRAGIVASDMPDLPGLDSVPGIYMIRMEQEIKSQRAGAIRHNGGANYAFADGHVKWLQPDKIVIDCNGDKPCFKP